MSVDNVQQLCNLLKDQKRKLSVLICSRMAREQTAEKIRTVEFVPELNAVVIFTEEEGDGDE